MTIKAYEPPFYVTPVSVCRCVDDPHEETVTVFNFPAKYQFGGRQRDDWYCRRCFHRLLRQYAGSRPFED